MLSKVSLGAVFTYPLPTVHHINTRHEAFTVRLEHTREQLLPVVVDVTHFRAIPQHLMVMVFDLGPKAGGIAQDHRLSRDYSGKLMERIPHIVDLRVGPYTRKSPLRLGRTDRDPSRPIKTMTNTISAKKRMYWSAQDLLCCVTICPCSRKAADSEHVADDSSPSSEDGHFSISRSSVRNVGNKGGWGCRGKTVLMGVGYGGSCL